MRVTIFSILLTKPLSGKFLSLGIYLFFLIVIFNFSESFILGGMYKCIRNVFFKKKLKIRGKMDMPELGSFFL